jgi:hypothetical protein
LEKLKIQCSHGVLDSFAISIECSSIISDDTWILTNVYAPCTSEGRQSFLDWFKNIDMPDGMDWLIIGDFNLTRKQIDRNKPGGNIQDWLINYLRLEELRLTGQKFTWTNKQESPLLEMLDCFFASASWIAAYPGSFVSTLSRDTSDHCPCLVIITTDIPKTKNFRFENYWLLHDGFMQIIEDGWNTPFFSLIKQKKLGAKFKNLRKVLRQWYAQ